MIKKEVTFNSVLINILGIVITIPLLVILGITFKSIHSIDSDLFIDQFISNFLQSSPMFIIFYIASLAAGIICHELLHGLAFSKFSIQGFKHVKFGFNAKALAPYAHCKVPLERNYYMLALLLPGVILGLIPATIALIIGDVLFYAWSLFFILAAIGDFILLFRIMFISKEHIISDHPSKVGFIATLMD
jgi:hypothetical protein